MKKDLPLLAVFLLISILLGCSSSWPEPFPTAVDTIVLFLGQFFFFLVLPRKMGRPMQIFVAMLAGIAAGWIFRNAGRADFVTDYLAIFGTLFILLLKMVIVPLVFFSIVHCQLVDSGHCLYPFHPSGICPVDRISELPGI